MLHVYINYPNTRFVAHQRRLTITVANVEAELQNFREIRYKFNSKLGKLDMWLEIELGNYDEEMTIATQIGQLLAQHYKQLKDIQLAVHCLSLEELRRQAGHTV